MQDAIAMSIDDPVQPLHFVPDLAKTHVVKRLSPTQAGALKHAERFGKKLVCVRYRHDPSGCTRYTTVELVVDSVTIKRRPEQTTAKPLRIVALRLRNDEHRLHNLLKDHGAVWNGKERLWYVNRTTAKALAMLDRIV